MIDHVSIPVSDLERSARFYVAVLTPLGFRQLTVRPRTVGFGKRYAEFWLNLREGMVRVADDTGMHICLRAPNAEAVNVFHAAAIAAGGVDVGAPGLRPEYSANYYAAFLTDLDGHRIEAVTFLNAER